MAAQAPPQIPRLPDGKPDFSGIWDRPFVIDMSKDGPNQKGAGDLPFNPLGLEKWKELQADKADFNASCLPMGPLRSMNSPYPIQLVSTPGQFVILAEMNNVFYVVPTGGRKHPGDLEPQWNGLSTGRWEGDTLVVETAHFNDKTRLDNQGHPHSCQLKLTQRFTRSDHDHIAYEITVDDPKTYSRPWKNTRTFTLRSDWEVLEYSCEENNKDVVDGHVK